MELGGHAPVIVCDDVDPVKVAATSVHRQDAQRRTGVRVADPLLRRRRDLRAGSPPPSPRRPRAIKLGNGLDAATQMGPLANPRRVEAMEALVADADAKGAKVLSGGTRSPTAATTFR